MKYPPLRFQDTSGRGACFVADGLDWKATVFWNGTEQCWAWQLDRRTKGGAVYKLVRHDTVPGPKESAAGRIRATIAATKAYEKEIRRERAEQRRVPTA